MIARNNYDSAEKEFIHRLRGGDERAWRQMFDRFDPLITSMAQQCLKPKDIDDLVQNVHIQLFRTINKYDASRSALVTWVMALTRYKCIDQLRKNRRSKTQISLEESLIESWEEDNAFLEDKRKLVTEVEGYLGNLRSEYRKAITLSYKIGLTHSQIAETLKIPIGTVKTNLRRGIAELREHFNTPEYREILDLA